jgi:hypothetical protein
MSGNVILPELLVTTQLASYLLKLEIARFKLEE